MRPAWLNWHSSRRNAGSAGAWPIRLRTLVQGGLASVLAVAGLVVFATEASAHNNIFQSVTGACNGAPTYGAGRHHHMDPVQRLESVRNRDVLDVPRHPQHDCLVHCGVTDAQRNSARCDRADLHADTVRGGPGGPVAQLDDQRELECDLDRLDLRDRHAVHHARTAPAAGRMQRAEDDPHHCDDPRAAHRRHAEQQLGRLGHGHRQSGWRRPAGLGQLLRVPGVLVLLVVLDVRQRWLPRGHREQPVVFERELVDLQPGDEIQPTECGHLLLLRGLRADAERELPGGMGAR